MHAFVAQMFGSRFVYLRDLLRELVARDFKIRYKDSVLGMAWSFINPLLHLLIFYFLFKLVLNVQIHRYSAFAFSGMLAYTWFQASLSQAAGSIKSARELVRQPGFPSAILPLVAVTGNLINFLIAIPVLMIVLLSSGIVPGLTFLLLPVVLLVQFVFTVSLAYLVAAVNVSFRDLEHILSVLLRLFFFITPIFYEASAVPAAYQPICYLNPMAHLVEAYRAILMHGAMPNWLPLVLVATVSTAFLFVSYRVFERASYHFVEEL